MDLSTMKTKVDDAAYGQGNDAVEAFYKDLLLMMDNCRLFNDDDSDVTEEAARIFAQLPELFGTAELAVLKKIGK
jgi:Bromodomain